MPSRKGNKDFKGLGKARTARHGEDGQDDEEEFRARIETVVRELAGRIDGYDPGYLPIKLVEEALLLLNLPVSARELNLIKSTLDPENSRRATLEDLSAVCLARRATAPKQRDYSDEADHIHCLLTRGRTHRRREGVTLEDLKRICLDHSGRGLGAQEQAVEDMMRVAMGIEDFDAPVLRAEVTREEIVELLKILD